MSNIRDLVQKDIEEHAGLLVGSFQEMRPTWCHLTAQVWLSKVVCYLSSHAKTIIFETSILVKDTINAEWRQVSSSFTVERIPA